MSLWDEWIHHSSLRHLGCVPFIPLGGNNLRVRSGRSELYRGHPSLVVGVGGLYDFLAQDNTGASRPIFSVLMFFIDCRCN
jgi:hypothetical protein